MEGDDRLLALLRYDIDLDLAILDEEDRIRRVALRKDLLILAICRHGPSAVNGVEEDLHVECTLLRLSHGVWHLPFNERLF